MNLEITSEKVQIIYDALFEYKMILKRISSGHSNGTESVKRCNEIIHKIENELLPMLESFIE